MFLHTNNKNQKEKLRKQSFLQSQAKQNNKLGINLNKEGKDLHTENCKVLLREIEDAKK